MVLQSKFFVEQGYRYPHIGEAFNMLANYVNEHKIDKANIENISHDGSAVNLLFWEDVPDQK